MVGPHAVAGSPILPALTSPRSVAIGAALALHVLFLGVTQHASAKARAPLTARVMTVRSIALAAAEPVALAKPSSSVTEAPAARSIATADVAMRLPSAPTRETRALASASTESTALPATAQPQIPERQGLWGTPADPQGAVAALPAAPDYLMGTRLDPGPQPIGEIEPEYPDSGHSREGTVVLRILISETGHVDDVAVVRSTPTGAFEEAAIEAFAKALFSPGRAAGTPVKSQITVEVQFVPINRGGRVSGRTY